MFLYMDDIFEEICKHVVDEEKGCFTFVLPNNKKTDEPHIAYIDKRCLRFYESLDKKLRVMMVPTFEQKKYYLIKVGEDYNGKISTLFVLVDKKIKNKVVEVKRHPKHEEKLDRNVMSIEFYNILCKLDVLGMIIIVDSKKEKLGDRRPVFYWNIVKLFGNKAEYYEDKKNKRYALLINNSVVYHLGLGNVDKMIFVLGVKKDKRSLKAFEPVEKPVYDSINRLFRLFDI